MPVWAMGICDICCGNAIMAEFIATMQRIAMPMVGGMGTATVLNLLVLPVIYSLVSRWAERQKPGDNHG